MSVSLLIAFNFSVLIAGLLAIFRFKKINKVYHPFLYCLWLGSINEVFSYVLMKRGHETLINNNIYVFVESILLLWLFKNLQPGRKKYELPLLLMLFISVWVGENFIFGTITVNSTYFRIVDSFVLVLLSINLINQTMATSRKAIFKNTNFLLCLGFITYFTYKVIIIAFALYGIESSNIFLLNIYTILTCVNLGTNLLYVFAVIWMPKSLRYSQPL